MRAAENRSRPGFRLRRPRNGRPETDMAAPRVVQLRRTIRARAGGVSGSAAIFASGNRLQIKDFQSRRRSLFLV